jgi:hypothetical protein
MLDRSRNTNSGTRSVPDTADGRRGAGWHPAPRSNGPHPNPPNPLPVGEGTKYVTFINPHAVKGVYVFARIARELARRRPDIPILVTQGRSRADGRGARPRIARITRMSWVDAGRCECRLIRADPCYPRSIASDRIRGASHHGNHECRELHKALREMPGLRLRVAAALPAEPASAIGPALGANGVAP